ncbi:MAG: biotin/lipoyl-containing protein, partial [Bdellovibrionales bacterium]
MPTNITMPALSPTMTEGTLAKWLKSEGDMVEAGDVIAEIETDKATMEVEAVDEGVLGKIVVSGGTENVKVNSVIAVLLDDGESAGDIDVANLNAEQPTPEKKEEEKSEAKESSGASQEIKKEEKTMVAASAPQQVSSQGGDRIFATPLAKRLAKDKNIDLAQVQG